MKTTLINIGKAVLYGLGAFVLLMVFIAVIITLWTLAANAGIPVPPPTHPNIAAMVDNFQYFGFMLGLIAIYWFMEKRAKKLSALEGEQHP